MTKRFTTDTPEDHHYKVRVVLSGGTLHLASADIPVLDMVKREWKATWLDDPDKGDSIGFIDWSAVIAVTWRWTGGAA
jgi:hypothetical protein